MARKIHFLILALWLGAFIHWHRADTRPPAWDESVHLHLALDYRDFLFHHIPVTTPWASVYMPLYHLSLIPALSIGMPSEAKAAVTHGVYLLLLLSALVPLAKRMGRSAEEGLWAGMLVIGYRHVLWVSQHPLMDFALLCWVVLGMALLFRTNGFSDRTASLLWGVVSGLGLLLKSSYVLFFIFPVAWTWHQGRRNFPEASGGRHAGMAVALAGLIGFPWYFWQGILFLQNLIGLMGERGAAENDPTFRTLAGWLYYFQTWVIQLGIPSLVFTLSGMALFLWKRRRTPGAGFLISWIGSGYFFLTLMHNKDPRYTLPLLPALALMAVFGWRSWETPFLRKGVPILIFGLFIWNMLHNDPPRREDWKHSEIGRILAAAHDPHQPFLIGSVLSNHPCFFGRTLRWSLRTQGIPFYTSSPGDPNADFTEFVITKSGDLGPDAESLIKEWNRLRRKGRGFSSLFSPYATLPLPDGSTATVYRRNPDPIFEVGPVTSTALAWRLKTIFQRTLIGPVHVSVEGVGPELQRGRVRRARVWGGPWAVQDVPVAEAFFEGHDLWFNLYTQWDEQKPGLLAFRELKAQIRVNARDLEQVLKKKVKDLRQAEVHFSDGKIRVNGIFHGIPVAVQVRLFLEQQPARMGATLEWLKIGGVPLPGWILGKVHRYDVPLDPIPSLPGRLAIHEIRLEKDFLTLS